MLLVNNSGAMVQRWSLRTRTLLRQMARSRSAIIEDHGDAVVPIGQYPSFHFSTFLLEKKKNDFVYLTSSWNKK
jgi:hypothetical protein